MAWDQKAYMREYMKGRNAKRKVLGLCAACGKEADKVKCKECRAKDNARQKERQTELVAQGICKMCGKRPAGEGHVHCDECLRKANVSTRKHAAKRREEGRCHACGTPCNGLLCETCRIKSREGLKLRRQRRLEASMCRDCGKEAIASNRSLRGKDRANYCQVCYLKRMARTMLGTGLKWTILLDKLEQCNWQCFYTGDKLILGDNLSFDHLDPVSRFPERRRDPENLVPCTWHINLMKRDLTKQEFLNLAHKVTLRFNPERFTC